MNKIRQRIITFLEKLFFMLVLHRRERKISEPFSQELSRQIDALHFLIDSGGENEN